MEVEAESKSKAQMSKVRSRSASSGARRRRKDVTPQVMNPARKTERGAGSSKPMSEETEGEPSHRKVKRRQLITMPMPIDECRKVFQKEVLILWKEVADFRQTCQQMMLKQRALLDSQTQSYDGQRKDGKLNTETRALVPARSGQDLARDLQSLEKNMEFLQRHQDMLDKEQLLLEKEEQMARRQSKLKAYEQEVEEIEKMLDKRHKICNKRTQEIEYLNDEVLVMKTDLENTMDTLETAEENRMTEKVRSNTEEASERARHRWALVRRNLVDKVSVLEATVQKYRTEVATATTTMTAKDMMITRLNEQIGELKSELETKDRKITQLESKLALTIQEHRKTEQQFDLLLEELQNMDFSSTYKAQLTPQKHVPSKMSRKLFKKQASSASLLSGDGGILGDSRPRTPKSDFLRRSLMGRGDSKSPRRLDMSHRNLNGTTILHSLDDDPPPGADSSAGDGESKQNSFFAQGSKACVVM